MALPRGYRNEAAKEPKALPAKGFLRMASVISVRFASETYGIRMNLLNKVHFCILSSRKSIVDKGERSIFKARRRNNLRRKASNIRTLPENGDLTDIDAMKQATTKHGMIRTIRAAALLALAMLALPGAAEGQTMALSPESSIWIDGTSNRSDWTVRANEIAGVVRAGEATAPDSLALTVASGEIKGDKGTIMNRKITGALKSREHPEIVYRLTGAAVSEADAATLLTEGELTIAGVTKTITMEVTAEPLEGGAVRYVGMAPILFTDYGMRPPSALAGALRTGNEVTVHFDVTFAPGE